MNKSLNFVLVILWAALTWRLTTTPNLIIADENILNMIVMMGGHFVFFGVQAILLAPLTHLAIPLASLYGLAIELVQLNVPGRSADPVDWILDTLGAITFVYFFTQLTKKPRQND